MANHTASAQVRGHNIFNDMVKISSDAYEVREDSEELGGASHPDWNFRDMFPDSINRPNENKPYHFANKDNMTLKDYQKLVKDKLNAVTKEDFHELYYVKGLSVKQIGALYSVSWKTASLAIQNTGLEIRRYTK